MWVPSAPAWAIGSLRYTDPIGASTGLGPVCRWVLFGGAAKVGPTAFGEVGERLLYGIAGLRASYLRGAVRRGRTGTMLSSVFLNTPVGGERRFALEIFEASPDKFATSFRVRFDTASIDGFRSARVISLGAGGVAAITGSLAVGYDVDAVRLAGESLPGPRSAIYAVGGAKAAVAWVLGFEIDAWGRSGVGIACRVRPGGPVGGAIGYFERTGVLEAAVRVQLGRLAVSFGTSQHPVIGLSKSIFVAWRSGQ